MSASIMQNRKINAYVAIALACMALVGFLLTPIRAQAGSQDDEIDQLVQTWKDRYGGSGNWKLRESSENEKQNAIQNGQVYHALPIDGHISQTTALRNAIRAVANKYSMSVSDIGTCTPHIFFLVENGDPYWQISLFRNSGDAITVGIEAVSGNTRFVSSQSNG